MRRRDVLSPGFFYFVMLTLFLYAPIVVLVVFSFNDSRTLVFPLRGFTLRWYGELAGARELLAAVVNSVVLGLMSSVAILLPFLWVRGGIRAFGATGFVLIACYLPFYWLAGSDAPTLSQFAQNWRFNPLLYAAFDAIAGPTAGRLLAAIAIVTLAVILYWRDAQAGSLRPRIPPADYALGALLLFSPVVNPWYLLWLLPFAVMRPSRTAWTATFLLPLSYWNGTNWNLGLTHEFDVPGVVTIIEIAVLAGAARYDRAKPIVSTPPI